MDANKMCICPGAAFGIPHVVFQIDGTKMNLCANCVLDTPSIAKKYGEIDERRALPEKCKYIPRVATFCNAFLFGKITHNCLCSIKW